MASSRRTFALAQTFVRHFGNTVGRNSSAVTEVTSSKFPKLKEIQKHFGIADHTPVYIKGGPIDKVLYGMTILLTVAGLGMSTEVLVKLSLK